MEYNISLLKLAKSFLINKVCFFKYYNKKYYQMNKSSFSNNKLQMGVFEQSFNQALVLDLYLKS